MGHSNSCGIGDCRGVNGARAPSHVVRDPGREMLGEIYPGPPGGLWQSPVAVARITCVSPVVGPDATVWGPVLNPLVGASVEERSGDFVQLRVDLLLGGHGIRELDGHDPITLQADHFPVFLLREQIHRPGAQTGPQHPVEGRR